MVINWYQLFATFSVSLCMVTSGMHMSWPSPSIPKLLNGSHGITITSDDASLLAVMSLIGSIFGGFIAGPVLNRFGRLKAVIFSFVPYTIAWLAIAFAPHAAFLFISRFIVGFTDSFAVTSVSIYVSEIADPHIRGLLGSYCAAAVIIGMLLINALGLYLSIYTTALISISIPALMVLSCILLPESPYFLIMNKQDEDAIKSLNKFKPAHVVQDEFVRLKLSIEEDTKQKGKFVDIFRVAYYRKAMLILTFLRCSKQFVGASAIAFYTDTIFSEVEGAISSETWVILFFIVKLLTTILATVIMDKVGRKPLLHISTVGITLSLLCVGVYSFLEEGGQVDMTDYDYIPIVALFVYIITYSIGLGTVAFLMLGELMPTNVKTHALCIVHSIYCLSGTLSTLYFQKTHDAFGLGVPFVSFAFCGFLTFGFVIFFAPETKGKTLEAIQDDFKNQTNQNLIKTNK